MGTHGIAPILNTCVESARLYQVLIMEVFNLRCVSTVVARDADPRSGRDNPSSLLGPLPRFVEALPSQTLCFVKSRQSIPAFSPSEPTRRGFPRGPTVGAAPAAGGAPTVRKHDEGVPVAYRDSGPVRREPFGSGDDVQRQRALSALTATAPAA